MARRDAVRVFVLVEGHTQREAERQFHMSRNTVAKLLAEPAAITMAQPASVTATLRTQDHFPRTRRVAQFSNCAVLTMSLTRTFKGKSRCAERAALAQYLLQAVEMDSAYVEGVAMADVHGDELVHYTDVVLGQTQYFGVGDASPGFHQVIEGKM